MNNRKLNLKLVTFNLDFIKRMYSLNCKKRMIKLNINSVLNDLKRKVEKENKFKVSA
jgi:hypothetical protein